MTTRFQRPEYFGRREWSGGDPACRAVPVRAAVSATASSDARLKSSQERSGKPGTEPAKGVVVRRSSGSWRDSTGPMDASLWRERLPSETELSDALVPRHHERDGVPAELEVVVDVPRDRRQREVVGR